MSEKISLDSSVLLYFFHPLLVMDKVKFYLCNKLIFSKNLLKISLQIS